MCDDEDERFGLRRNSDDNIHSKARGLFAHGLGAVEGKRRLYRMREKNRWLHHDGVDKFDSRQTAVDSIHIAS